MTHATDICHLEHAARLAMRGHGHVEPNPMVGCVIVDPRIPGGEVVGWGYHCRFGGAHAEVEALQRAGDRARGATVYVTLEPCSHEGKTPPCTEALLRAGIARVVIAQSDPHPDHGGGAAILREHGVQVDFRPEFQLATLVSAPFRHRAQTGLPWVVAKWAQSIDGCVATRTGDSKWISSDRSRRMVHRERGRVDAILTGIGTVLADDPMLTARDGRARRVARRVVIDTHLQIPLDSKIVTTAHDVPTTIACACGGSPIESKRQELESHGIEVMAVESSDSSGHLRLTEVMLRLVIEHDVTNVLTECGPGLLGSLLAENLVAMCWVFTAPIVLGDDEALRAVRGFKCPSIGEVAWFAPIEVRQRAADIAALYRVST